MKETNPVFVKLGELRSAYDESENPVVSSLRSVTSTIGGWFEETENAQVVRLFRAIDPTFSMDVFERELREYIVPEVVDAYLSADGDSLKKWCSEAVGRSISYPERRMLTEVQTYNVLWATMDQYLKSGLVSDSKVLDIRQVDITSGKLLEVSDTTLPVFVVTFNTQEVLLFRNAKTKEVVVGKEDRVEQCMYAAVITRIEEEMDDELTGGWKVVEVGIFLFHHFEAETESL
jgi:mitochondrial import inner membrane translocase subunit TIM44